LNAAGILVGGIVGLTASKQLSPVAQFAIKGLMGIATVFVGLRMTLMSLGPDFWNAGRQLIIVVLALILGRISGRLLHLQKFSNRMGQYAKEKISQSHTTASSRFAEGFVTCTILFCVGPMAILGALQDGLDGKWQTLGIKALMDGFATMAFVTTFGAGAILAVIPVIAYQGTITLGARLLAPFLRDHALVDAVTATGGLLVFCIALIILEIKKIELADYLPSLLFAPLLSWLWR
jgi:hypothetical protein